MEKRVLLSLSISAAFLLVGCGTEKVDVPTVAESTQLTIPTPISTRRIFSKPTSQPTDTPTPIPTPTQQYRIDEDGVLEEYVEGSWRIIALSRNSRESAAGSSTRRKRVATD